MMNRQRGANYQFVCFGTAATIISKDAALSAGFFLCFLRSPQTSISRCRCSDLGKRIRGYYHNCTGDLNVT
jgi:hypothetical protein